MKKSVYILLGFISLVLAYFGIIMPGVPGIPFVLAAAFFFARSSDRLYGWMLKQKIMAKILQKNAEGKASTGFKLLVISQLWVSIIVAEWLFISNIYYGILLVLAGIGFSYLTYLLMSK